MTDLTLHEYKDFSEEELKRILRVEALKIFGADTLVKKEVVISLSDSGDRRSGTDRRQFSYFSHIPERRCGQERRSGVDRRSRKRILGATRLQK
jgi:hypothetical protein